MSDVEPADWDESPKCTEELVGGDPADLAERLAQQEKAILETRRPATKGNGTTQGPAVTAPKPSRKRDPREKKVAQDKELNQKAQCLESLEKI